MAMIKRVATEQLKLLVFIFMLGNAFHAFPANPANSCPSDTYPRLLKFQYLLASYIVAAAIFLLAVRMAVNWAEDGAVAAARAVKGRDFDAAHEAAAAAAKGIASVRAGWDMRFVRCLLCMAVLLSGAASLVAVEAFEDGYLYRTGCHNAYSAGSPFLNIRTWLMFSVHSFSAWVAVWLN